jgi:disulfide bond formation protein DsbB
MDALVARLTERGTAALLVLLGGTATIGAALFSEAVLGLFPCKLCLIQRWPYYIALPIALALVLLPLTDTGRRAGLAALALIFLVSAGLGAHHAGVEWGFWPGPNDCGGAPAPAASGMGDFLKQLESARVVSCTEAAGRFLGLSMAGWNAAVSLALAGFAAFSALAPARRSST